MGTDRFEQQQQQQQQQTAEPAARAATAFESEPAETGRIVQTGTVWTAAGVLAPAIGLGPLAASGWRPAVLPIGLEVIWWIGAVAAAAGLALLIWAGCPVLGFRLPEAHRQKVVSIRVGIALDVAGMTVAGLAVLLSPPGS